MGDFKIDVKIDKNILTMKDEMFKNLQDAVKTATLMVKEEVKENIMTGYEKADLGWKPISKSYEKQLEKKGLLPHNGLFSPKQDKKKLQDSISVKFRSGGLTGIITTDRPYAIYVEKGTSKMPARPFFEPALKRKQKEVEEIIKNAIEDSLK
ncbi:HK97-gp10 family putative phage morphogenesis protein [Methanothermococcus okinawensis]|uniref:Phage protein, HK97 gp10 family n=1 Tax=Methanothermococcus okinawensis (strain DSM 14208 / JCM 11175 / IH1) TaxID=647113 RepID=F8AKB3_METOI|nr:HK97-gp10 family putative phage morphogenesis protein [Methanothermococcus okinawensis]AEH06313.1 phage protein, HK97 gp10 family [Methanothermococcus okinawensis IH1]